MAVSMYQAHMCSGLFCVVVQIVRKTASPQGQVGPETPSLLFSKFWTQVQGYVYLEEEHLSLI